MGATFACANAASVMPTTPAATSADVARSLDFIRFLSLCCGAVAGAPAPTDAPDRDMCPTRDRARSLPADCPMGQGGYAPLLRQSPGLWRSRHSLAAGSPWSTEG